MKELTNNAIIEYKMITTIVGIRNTLIFCVFDSRNDPLNSAAICTLLNKIRISSEAEEGTSIPK